MEFRFNMGEVEEALRAYFDIDQAFETCKVDEDEDMIHALVFSTEPNEEDEPLKVGDTVRLKDSVTDEDLDALCLRRASVPDGVTIKGPYGDGGVTVTGGWYVPLEFLERV